MGKGLKNARQLIGSNASAGIANNKLKKSVGICDWIALIEQDLTIRNDVRKAGSHRIQYQKRFQNDKRDGPETEVEECSLSRKILNRKCA